jgi:hypothetical protein
LLRLARRPNSTEWVLIYINLKARAGRRWTGKPLQNC